ncbi:MAG: TonB-dependent receptor plug [Gemmatimonadetes bacterium]|nr:TonB-dependent receptor plug [Gemmatimonadota bacterium]
MRSLTVCIAATLVLAPVVIQAQAGDTAMLRRFCGDTLHKPETGALVGRVRSADDGTPLAGVTVLVRWNEVGVDKSSGSVSAVPRTLASVTDAQALYRFCALPRYTPLVAQTQAGDRNSGIVDLKIADEPVLVHGFSLSLRAQSDSEPRGTATILGEVVTPTGEAVRDARVNLDGLSSSVISNDTGVFMLPRLPPGSQTVIVRRIGYLPKRIAVELREGATTALAIVLDKTVRVLDSVRVIGKRYSSQEEFLAEFEQRKRASPGGIFYTEEYLRRHVYRDTPDIFRNIAGLTVSPDGVVSLTRGAASLTDSRCVPALFIDDIKMDTTLDIVRPHEIRAVEIYKSAASVPPMYNDPCGAIVIWTK